MVNRYKVASQACMALILLMSTSMHAGLGGSKDTQEAFEKSAGEFSLQTEGESSGEDAEQTERNWNRIEETIAACLHAEECVNPVYNVTARGDAGSSVKTHPRMKKRYLSCCCPDLLKTMLWECISSCCQRFRKHKKQDVVFDPADWDDRGQSNADWHLVD